MRNHRKSRFLLILLTGIWSNSYALESSLSPQQTVEELMGQIDWHYQQAAKKLRADLPMDEQSNEDFKELHKLFAQLKTSYKPMYRSSEQEWTGYTDRVVSSLDNAEAAWRLGDFAAGKTALTQLEAERDRAHQEFHPGFFGRMKRIFSKHKKEEKK